VTYKLRPNGVLRIADGANIPADDANLDWVRYQEWLALGNTPTRYVPPVPDPRIVLDNEEAAAAKIDAQIQADLNMTPAEVNSTVDTLFAGFTAGQRAFLKRLVRLVLAASRKVLR